MTGKIKDQVTQWRRQIDKNRSKFKKEIKMSVHPFRIADVGPSPLETSALFDLICQDGQKCQFLASGIGYETFVFERR